MKCKFNKWSCRAQFARYDNNGNLAIDLIADGSDQEDVFDGEPIATATTNISPLSEGLVAIKNYSENEGMVVSLSQAGIIEPTPIDWMHEGYVSVPVFRLSEQALNEVRSAGLL